MKTAINWRGVVALLAVLVPLPWSAAFATTGLPCRYEIVHVLQVPPCIFANGVEAHGISPNGRYVCGGLSFCDDAWLFVFDTQTGQRTEIAMPPGTYDPRGLDITDERVLCGNYGRLGVGYRGFVYDMNTAQWTEMVSANPSGLGWSEVRAINSHGSVCGKRSIGSKGDPVHPETAFTWSAKDGFTDVGLIDGWSTFGIDISDTGVMVGSVVSQHSIEELARGIVFENGKITVLGVVPNGFSSVATKINANGDLVWSGLVQLDPLLARTFVRRRDESTPLPLPPGMDRCGVIRLTNSGLIAGQCNSFAVPEPFRYFIWRGQQWLTVDIMLPEGQQIRRVADMSDDGTMVMQISAGNNSRSVVTRPIWPGQGDINCDEVVNVDDLLGVINAWGPCESGCPTDFDENAVTNVFDLIVVLENWG